MTLEELIEVVSAFQEAFESKSTRVEAKIEKRYLRIIIKEKNLNSPALVRSAHRFISWKELESSVKPHVLVANAFNEAMAEVRMQ